MPLRQKKLLKFVITHKNQDLEKAVLVVVARSAKQIYGRLVSS